jgi:hypothetical protein
MSTSLHARFLACLARHDLVHLICMGAPQHEYRPETPLLIDWFAEHPVAELEQVTPAVKEIFTRMFGPTVVSQDLDYYQAAAQELLGIWQAWQRERIK